MTEKQIDRHAEVQHFSMVKLPKVCSVLIAAICLLTAVQQKQAEICMLFAIHCRMQNHPCLGHGLQNWAKYVIDKYTKGCTRSA